MIVEKIILKSKSTNLEVIAHYSNKYTYNLSVGESCYSVIAEFNGVEYIICVSRAYKTIYSIAELLTGLLCYPLAVNRITRIKDGYNIVRDSVCVNAYSKAIESDLKNTVKREREQLFSEYTLSDDDLQCDIDFDLTDRNWGNDNK